MVIAERGKECRVIPSACLSFQSWSGCLFVVFFGLAIESWDRVIPRRELFFSFIVIISCSRIPYHWFFLSRLILFFLRPTGFVSRACFV